MAFNRPFYRICRPFIDGEYTHGEIGYLGDPRYAANAVHFIRAYQLLESDLIRLLTYIEPSDDNLETYSHRLYELLLRACTEFEANAKAILAANGYSKKANWDILDYAKLEPACQLSEFKTELPIWRGSHSIRTPFAEWATAPRQSPRWYGEYNRVKHDRPVNFKYANLANVLDAVSSVFIMLFAQFHIVVFNPYRNLSFYNQTESGALSHPSLFLQITLPKWPPTESYDFDWSSLKTSPDPIAKYAF
jgi:hypothetical protein